MCQRERKQKQKIRTPLPPSDTQPAIEEDLGGRARWEVMMQQGSSQAQRVQIKKIVTGGMKKMCYKLKRGVKTKCWSHRNGQTVCTHLLARPVNRRSGQAVSPGHAWRSVLYDHCYITLLSLLLSPEGLIKHVFFFYLEIPLLLKIVPLRLLLLFKLKQGCPACWPLTTDLVWWFWVEGSMLLQSLVLTLVSVVKHFISGLGVSVQELSQQRKL